MEIPNKWFEILERKGTALTAENLLNEMSWYMDTIMAEWGHSGESSRYHRAQRVLLDVREKSGRIGNFGERNRLYRQEDDLLHFLAVCRTVQILSGKPL